MLELETPLPPSWDPSTPPVPVEESCELSVVGMLLPVSEPLLPQAASSSAAPRVSAIGAGIILKFIEVPISCDSESSRSTCEPARQSGRSWGEIRASRDKYGGFWRRLGSAWPRCLERFMAIDWRP